MIAEAEGTGEEKTEMVDWVEHFCFKQNSSFLVFFFFYKFIYFIYLFLAALGLHCCVRPFSSCGERGLLFVAARRLSIAVASLVAEHGLQAHELQ